LKSTFVVFVSFGWGLWRGQVVVDYLWVVRIWRLGGPGLPILRESCGGRERKLAERTFCSVFFFFQGSVISFDCLCTPAMSTPARRRLIRDFKVLKEDPPAGISGAPCENNIMKWNAVIFGPDDTAWEGGTFKLVLVFSEDYPKEAPLVKFVSKLFHPNVYADGGICLDILQNNWSPILDISAVSIHRFGVERFLPVSRIDV